MSSAINHFKPLSGYLTVHKSRIHGLGIIAKKDIQTDTDLGISHIKDDEYRDGLIRTPLGGFINHSDKPNCKYTLAGKNLRVVTIRKIKKGEEVTVSYRGYYSDDVLDTYK